MIKRRLSFSETVKKNDGMSINRRYYDKFTKDVLGLNKMKRTYSKLQIGRYGKLLSNRRSVIGHIYDLSIKEKSCMEAWMKIPKECRLEVLVLLKDLCIRYNLSVLRVPIHKSGAPTNKFIGNESEWRMNILESFIKEKERPIIKIQKWAKKRLKCSGKATN